MERLLKTGKTLQSSIHVSSSYEKTHGRKTTQMHGKISFRCFKFKPDCLIDWIRNFYSTLTILRIDRNSRWSVNLNFFVHDRNAASKIPSFISGLNGRQFYDVLGRLVKLPSSSISMLIYLRLKISRQILYCRSFELLLIL